MSSSQKKTTILYDGECDMCIAFTKKIDSNDFEKINMHQQIPEGLTKEEVEKEIHVISADGKVYKGSSAVLIILEQYSRLKFIAKLGNIPFIKHILSLCYKFVANNRKLIFGPSSKIFWLKIVVALGFISGLLLTSKLWTGNRLYPMYSLLQEWKNGYMYLVILIALLVSIIVSSKPKKYIIAFVIGIITLILFDLSRLQPWVYQYIFMLIAIGLYSWKQDTALNICRFIIVSIYVWSGLHKINPNFPGLFTWLMEPVSGPSELLNSLALVVPFIEIGIGLSLLNKKTRNSGVICAVAMHVIILSLIGPFGHNMNSAIWPWNIAMPLCVIILFWKSIFSLSKSIYSYTVIILFGIMPFFSFFGLWDLYISSALYSGDTPYGFVVMNREVGKNLPVELQPYIYEVNSNEYLLDISRWSLGEINVPPYPEERVFKNILKFICTYSSSADVKLLIDGKGKIETFTCPNIKL